jgi:hypothetical protein
VMTALEKRSYKRARDSVHEMKEELSKDDYLSMLTTVSKAYEKGEYAFTASGITYYASPKGIGELVAEITGATRDDVDSLMEDKADEVTILVLAVIRDSFPNVLTLLSLLEQQGNPAILKLIEQMKQMRCKSE